MLLISGETGAGKSTLLKDLANIFYCNIINLETDIDSSMLFINFLKNKLSDSDTSNDREKILFFDAFEKIRPGATRKEIKEQIRTIDELVINYQCVIISIRSNFLLNYLDEGFSKYKLLELLPLEDVAVKNIAKKITGNDEFYNAIYSSDGLIEISKKPLLLSLLIDVYKHGGELSLFDSKLDLFDYVVDKWLIRDENSSPINANSRLIITKRLAINCLNSGKNTFTYSDINSAIEEQYGDLGELSLERYNNAIRNCSFIRNNNSGYFEFQHAAFLEYCIARAIIDDLILNNYDSFSWASFNAEVIENIYDLLTRFNLKNIISNSIKKAFIDSSDSRKTTNLLKLANKLGENNLPLDGITLYNENLSGINFSHRDIVSATFENCDFAGANLANLTARNWKFKDCSLKNCHFDNVKINSPQIIDSIIYVSSNETLHINFANCTRLELSVDYNGIIEFTGGKINEGLIETKNYSADTEFRPKKSSIKFAELERLLFSDCASGFYIGFCSVDELTLYSLYNLEKALKASLSDDIENACKQWRNGGSKIKKLTSPFVRVDDKPANPIEQCLSKTKLKKYRRRAEKVKKMKDDF